MIGACCGLIRPAHVASNTSAVIKHICPPFCAFCTHSLEDGGGNISAFKHSQTLLCGTVALWVQSDTGAWGVTV